MTPSLLPRLTEPPSQARCSAPALAPAAPQTQPRVPVRGLRESPQGMNEGPLPSVAWARSESRLFPLPPPEALGQTWLTGPPPSPGRRREEEEERGGCQEKAGTRGTRASVAPGSPGRTCAPAPGPAVRAAPAPPAAPPSPALPGRNGLLDVPVEKPRSSVLGCTPFDSLRPGLSLPASGRFPNPGPGGRDARSPSPRPPRVYLQ